MAGPIRFHLDEHIHPAIGVALRARGIDVSTSVDADLLSADDEKHIEFALNENRIIVTHDDDFLGWAAKGVDHAGICYCHPQARTIGEIIAMLTIVAECATAEEMRGRVEFI